MVRRKKQSLPRRSSAKNLKNQQTTVQRGGVQSHLSRDNYSNRDRKLRSVIRGKAISLQPFFGSVSNREEIIWCPIERAHGTKNCQITMAVLKIQIMISSN